jgi:hypothetical protein
MAQGQWVSRADRHIGQDYIFSSIALVLLVSIAVVAPAAAICSNDSGERAGWPDSLGAFERTLLTGPRGDGSAMHADQHGGNPGVHLEAVEAMAPMSGEQQQFIAAGFPTRLNSRAPEPPPPRTS